MSDLEHASRRALLQALAASPLLSSAAQAQVAQAQTAPASTVSLPVSVRDWGVAGNNDPADTARIQKALDEAPVGCDLIFPAGAYLTTAQLNLTRKINLVGQGARIYGDFGENREADLIALNVGDSHNADNRNQRIEGLELGFATGGRNAVAVYNRPPNLANIGMLIQNNTISVLPQSSGHAVHLEGLGTHFVTIRDCQIQNGIYLACADATIITGCLIFGLKPAITLDLIQGAFQTRIFNNGLVARDGALVVRGASQLFFHHNHIEQANVYGKNASKFAASVTIDPRSYGSRFIRMEHNNFGGGYNAQTSIHVTRDCEELFIDHNVFNVTESRQDIRLMDPSVRWTRIGPNNVARGLVSERPGLDPADPVTVLDRGTGTYGVRKSLGPASSGWANVRYRKTLDNLVHFEGALPPSEGSASAGIALPSGFRPRAATMLACATDAPGETASLAIGADGAVRVLGRRAGATVYLDGVSLPCEGRTEHSPGV